MKKILTILLLIFPMYSFPQTEYIEETVYEMNAGIFEYDASITGFKSEDIYCYLRLLQNGYYEVTLEYFLLDDVVVGESVSEGDYVFNDSILTLNDYYGNFNMEFIKRGDDLYPMKTYWFMKDKSFMFSNKTITKFSESYLKHRHTMVKEGTKRISGFVSKYNDSYKLKLGMYADRNRNTPIELHIKSEHSYNLSCVGIVISRGEYEVKDNILILKDEDLNCEYELLIGEDCLMSKRIPTEYGCLLKYENEK